MTIEPKSDHGSEGGDPPCWAHVTGDEPAGMSTEQLGRLVHRLADAVLVADPSGTITYWNEAAERLFGWSAAEATGQTLDLIIPERLRGRHWEGWHEVMATGETRYGDTLLEVPAQTRDGRRLSIAFTVSLLTDAGTSEISAVAAVVRDDTARWQERRDQRDEIARLRAELAASVEPVNLPRQ